MAESGENEPDDLNQDRDETQSKESEGEERRGPNSYVPGWIRRYPPDLGEQFVLPRPDYWNPVHPEQSRARPDYWNPAHPEQSRARPDYWNPAHLEQGRATEARITIPDDPYHRGSSPEVAELRQLLQQQHLEMVDLKRQLAQSSPAQPAVPVDKVFLESLAPMEYSGEGDFQEYLNQFEAMAETLFWTEAKKGSALYGRLKGRALACVSSCPDRRFSTLVQRLRDRFSPRDEEMFYQQLTTYRKKTDQSWEDLAQEMERLSIKAYSGMEEKYRDSMAAKAFVEAVVDKDVRRRLRQKHPKTVNEAVRHARIIEADQLREDLWQDYEKDKDKGSKDKKSEKARAVETTEPKGSAAQMTVAAPKKTPAKTGSKSGKRNQGPRGPRNTRRAITCFLCGLEGHVQRKCPFKLMTGVSSAQMPHGGLAQFPCPALPMPPGLINQYQDQSGTRQENYKGQTQFPAALRNLPKPQ